MSEMIDLAQKARSSIIAGSLYLATVILGGLSFLAGRDMVLRNYVRFFPGEAQAAAEGKGTMSFLNILITFPLAILLIAVIVGGFEYHYRRVGQPQSWWLLARTLAVEFAILLLALFI